MAQAFQPWPLALYQTGIGGQPVIAAYGPMRGGSIQNPASAADQGLTVTEVLWVDIVQAATAGTNSTSVPLQPGQLFTIPADFTGLVSVLALSTGHRFSGVVLQDPTVVIPATGGFPPDGPTTLTKTIPTYLYQQYSDDGNLQAFFGAFNSQAQAYVDWFATISLPVYVSDTITGALLDWVAAGLYGMTRPVLPSGTNLDTGPLNTYALDGLSLNEGEHVGPSNFFQTTDDIFKRILTWHLYKGDGKIFNIRWLKRRIMRFLTGTNGLGGMTDATYPVSVTFGAGNQVNINLRSVRIVGVDDCAILGAGTMNGFVLNEATVQTFVVPVSPLVPVFKAAVEAGVLELPFQFTFIVNTDTP